MSAVCSGLSPPGKHLCIFMRAGVLPSKPGLSQGNTAVQEQQLQRGVYKDGSQHKRSHSKSYLPGLPQQLPPLLALWLSAVRQEVLWLQQQCHRLSRTRLLVGASLCSVQQWLWPEHRRKNLPALRFRLPALPQRLRRLMYRQHSARAGSL